MLLGTDLVKDPAVLEAAYNDAAGVTAAFNRNVLAVINRELDADFDLDAFEHVAFYDREQEWIEMRLRARAADGRPRRASSGSTSTSPTARSCAPRSAPSSRASGSRPTCAAAGLVLDQFLTDADELFALSLIGAAANSLITAS